MDNSDNMLRYWCFLLLAAINLAAAQNCNGPPPFHVNPQTCCNHPKVVDDQIFMGCFSDFRQTGLQKRQAGAFPPSPQSPQNCIGECVFKTVKVWNNGEIDISAAQRYFTTGLSSTPEWIPIVSTGFSKCSNQAKTIGGFLPNNSGDCSPVPALTLACLHSHVITNCPDNLWNNSSDCNELKSYFANCPLPPKH